MQNLTIRQKITQMFILGFEGDNFSSNKYLKSLLKDGLGGIIFFTNNIKTVSKFRNLILDLKKEALIPLFYSIDQEGGRVERTENIHKGKKYLSARQAYKMGLSFLQNQTKEIALELKSYGINMNFAPVLDVNTNETNPIIGERAFSNKPDEVIEGAKVTLEEYKKHLIVTVGKHFPGHGASCSDSHKTLPVIDLSKEDLYQNHIRTFKYAIVNGVPAIMCAHVLYPALTDEKVPASVSKKIIDDILRKELNFQNIIMTDDMEMNGIKGFSKIDACIMAINAGVDMFIFRNTTKDIYNLIEQIEKAVNMGLIPKENIDKSFDRIMKIKHQYVIV